jgi:hypothetical protein
MYYPKKIKVLLIGNNNAGKTTCLRLFCNANEGATT